MDQAKLLETFLTEASELVQDLEIDLIELENSKNKSELVNKIFRAVHTIKGSAGVVGLTSLSNFVHSLENVLDLVRDDKVAISNELISILLRATDLTKAMLKEASGEVAMVDEREKQFILDMLKQFLPADHNNAKNKQTINKRKKNKRCTYFEIEIKLNENLFETGIDPIMLLKELSELGKIIELRVDTTQLPDFHTIDIYKLYLSWHLILETKEPFSRVENVFIFVQDNSEISIKDVSQFFKDGVDLRIADKKLGEILAEKGLVREEDIQEALSYQPKIGELLVQKGKVRKEDVALVLEKQLKSREIQKAMTIRVDTEKLDKLVNLVGEMVIAVARVSQQSQVQSEKRAIEASMEALERISRELQEQVMRIRMIPIEGLFSRFHRVIRDLANDEDKKVQLELSGVETELDKNVIEKLSDPLKHLIRNAVDHGIELPEDRKKAGKPEEALVKLSAYQQEGNIIIEVTDDGAGIDKSKILSNAVKKGLVKEEQELSEAEIYSLIFMPGFSTADKVTEVSGRGVGLDVVRQNIEELKGSIEVISEKGKGTTFKIKLPLTLAIIDGMKVKVGSEILTIPLLSIIESIRPKKEAIKTVEGSGEVVDARGEYLPLVRLYEVFNIDTDRTDPSEALVVIVESGNRRFGILVDDVLGQQQAVIKSLEKNFRQVEGASGATILGDGSVSLIVDIHSLEKIAFERNVKNATKALTYTAAA